MAPDLGFYQVTVTAMTVIAEVLWYAATYKAVSYSSWKSVWWHTALVSMVVVVHLPALMYWIKCDISVDSWDNCFQLSFIPFATFYVISSSLSGSVWLQGADSEQLVMTARSKLWVQRRRDIFTSLTERRRLLYLNQQRLQMRCRYCLSEWNRDAVERVKFGSKAKTTLIWIRMKYVHVVAQWGRLHVSTLRFEFVRYIFNKLYAMRKCSLYRYTVV